VDCSHVRLGLHCDYKGVVTHGNQPLAAIKTDQVQADLIRLQKIYSQVLPVQLQWHQSKDIQMAPHDLSIYLWSNN